MTKWLAVILWYSIWCKVWPMDWTTTDTLIKTLPNAVPWFAGYFFIMGVADKVNLK